MTLRAGITIFKLFGEYVACVATNSGVEVCRRDRVLRINGRMWRLCSMPRLLAVTKASASPNQLNNFNANAESHPPPLYLMLMLT